MCPERNGRIDADELLSLTDDRTRIVAISWVQYSSGYRSDLERIGQAVRKRDALFVVDVIQGLGVLPIDVEAQFVDVAAGACHKWLLAPEGIGLLYISDRARDRIQPTLTGWVSVREHEKYDDFDQELKISTLPWETGTGPTSLFYGLSAGLNILSEYGTAECAAYLEGLTDYLCEGLQSRGYEIVSSRSRAEKSQIVSIKPKHNTSAMSLYARLKSEGIIVAPRGERIRFSPHIYNDRSDIDRLMSSLP
jgi:cysteine desulfurase/selenocysteine lyase